MVIKLNQNSKNSKKHYGAKLPTEEREVNGQSCFLQGLFSIFLSQKCKVTAAEVPRDEEIHHLITSRASGHPDPSDFVFLTKYLLLPPLLKIEVLRPSLSCQLSPNPPKIHRCIPFFNTDF